jgi:hypothetical protein
MTLPAIIAIFRGGHFFFSMILSILRFIWMHIFLYPETNTMPSTVFV